MTHGINARNLVRDVGEFGLIDSLQEALPDSVRASTAVELGIGDDAALFTVPTGHSLVVTSDAMVSGMGRHFRLDWTDWPSLGHKLLAVNLSDLAAMGADPIGAVVTLGLTGSEALDDLEAMYRGLGALAEKYGVVIAGGDIVRSPDALFFDLTAFGSVGTGRAIRRGGAQVGDLIVVSGMLGASAAGMALLESGDRGAMTADLLIEAHVKPQPRIGLGRILFDHGCTAAMDLSDGLFGDLPKLLHRSRVAARIERERIPIPAAVRALFPERWFELGTTGGEDYELLLTVPGGRIEDFQQAATAVGSTLTVIGVVTNGPVGQIELIDGEGCATQLRAGAFDHFR